jgi:hypothetical protein
LSLTVLLVLMLGLVLVWVWVPRLGLVLVLPLRTVVMPRGAWLRLWAVAVMWLPWWAVFFFLVDILPDVRGCMRGA